jgi:hypothetical protein
MIPHIEKALRSFTDAEVLEAVEAKKQGRVPKRDPLRTAEFKQFISAQPEQAGDYPGPGEEFFIRRAVSRGGLPPGVARVVLAHRLREARVQTGFTRFEAKTPDLQGEFSEEDIGVRTAPLAARVTWLPGVEVRGEGLFVQLDEDAVRRWEARPEVVERVRALAAGYRSWIRRRTGGRPEKEARLPEFYGGRYYLLHSLSHLLIQAVSLECGYSASAIRERIYCSRPGEATPMAALLLSTGTTGTEGTLGGLLAQGRVLRQHLGRAFDLGVLCSNDPVCAAHDPVHDPTERNLEGAACHGCLFIAEPSCEQFNHFLDRALVFPSIGLERVAFFTERP